MNVFKCKICGDPYVGNTKPSNCPFCGAPAKFIILAENWVEPEASELSETSKNLLEKSLEMEIDNAQFYLCAVSATEASQAWAWASRRLFFSLISGARRQSLLDLQSRAMAA